MKSQNYFKKIAIAAIGLFAVNTQANNLKITGTSVDTSAGKRILLLPITMRSGYFLNTKIVQINFGNTPT